MIPGSSVLDGRAGDVVLEGEQEPLVAGELGHERLRVLVEPGVVAERLDGRLERARARERGQMEAEVPRAVVARERLERLELLRQGNVVHPFRNGRSPRTVTGGPGGGRAPR